MEALRAFNFLNNAGLPTFSGCFLNKKNIYNRNDDLENDLDQLKGNYEEKLKAIQNQLHQSAKNLQQYQLVSKTHFF